MNPPCRHDPSQQCVIISGCYSCECHRAMIERKSKWPLAQLLAEIRPRDASHWCEAELCACMGCANGTVLRFGYTKADWEAWRDSMTSGAR
jgi:hypothetical protein